MVVQCVRRFRLLRAVSAEPRAGNRWFVARTAVQQFSGSFLKMQAVAGTSGTSTTILKGSLEQNLSLLLFFSFLRCKSYDILLENWSKRSF